MAPKNSFIASLNKTLFGSLILLLVCFGRDGREMAWTNVAAANAVETTVDVTLTEYRIDMPVALQAGWTTLRTTNAGKKEHSFKIKGNELEKKLESHLKPGHSATLQVDLKPGTYGVSCPEDDHDDDKDMKLELRVSR
ncbi:MAG: cupredoxin domain-containing protein [Acidobacteria bacterium]|nr:cupredoxin domain-containing protein [Acidobacteriota bacterium]MCI0623115.1 cupredoxin domain-containing protein [Acidobacteriota bacterium]MCI0720838.1 cupredoxin domain-containing protein [Acidobacteriota bacterium]